MNGPSARAGDLDDAARRLKWNIEKSFRMSKSDLRARPIYHRKRDSIEAHLTIVFAALAVTRFIEDRTGWSIRKFVRTARRYRTVQIRAGRVSNPRSGDCPGDERQHEPRDDDRHPRIVQTVPALVLLAPVGGVMVSCPGSGAVCDRDEQGPGRDGCRAG